MRRQRPEQALQRSVAELLDQLGWLWCHVPNGGWRTKTEAAIFQGLGVKPGVPDILIFENWIVDRYGGFGLAIELKAGRGKVTPSQGSWISELTKRGWLCYVARNMDDVMSIIVKVNPRNLRRPL